MHWTLALLSIAALSALGCSQTELVYPDDGGVDCPVGPTPMLHLHIHAASGPVPADTKVSVSWSAGAESPFELDDPSTWTSLADGNVICDVDKDAPPPKDLAELVCHLWTSGATHVDVRAWGYTPFVKTLKPTTVEACKGPVPTDVPIELAVAAGAP